MLCRETVAVYCENHTEHINTLCGQNAKFFYAKSCGTYSNRCALEASNKENVFLYLLWFIYGYCHKRRL
jgi:hypothetical protein